MARDPFAETLARCAAAAAPPEDSLEPERDLLTAALAQYALSAPDDRAAVFLRDEDRWTLTAWAGFGGVDLPELAGVYGHVGELDEAAEASEPRRYPDPDRPLVSAALAGAAGGGAVLAAVPIGGRVDGVLLRALAQDADRLEADRTQALALLLGARLGEIRGRHALRAAHGALNRLTGVVGDAIVVSDARGAVSWTNDRAAVAFGAPPGALAGHRLDALLPGIAVDEERWEGRARPVIGAPRDVVVESQPFVDGDPERAWVHLVHTPTEIEERRALLAGVIDVDLDTGLPNHHGLVRAVESELALARKYNAFCSVLVVEVEGLTAHGEQMDEPEDLYRAVDEAIGRGLRRSDTVGRLPADRYGVLLSRGSRDQARELAPRLIKLVKSASALAAGLPRGLPAIVGIAHFPDDGVSPDEILGSALMAIEQARDKKKKWAFFEDDDARLRSGELEAPVPWPHESASTPGAPTTGLPVEDEHLIAQIDDLFEVEAGSASMSTSGTYSPLAVPEGGDHETLSGPMPLRHDPDETPSGPINRPQPLRRDPDETPSGPVERPAALHGRGEVLQNDSSELLLALGEE